MQGSSEHIIQSAFAEWCSWNPLGLHDLDLIYAIPNGGKRGIRTAIKLKREGVKRGVPDMCLPVPKFLFHGMYLEFKSAEGSPTKEQRVYLNRLHSLGYRVKVVRSLDEAIQTTREYYSIAQKSVTA